MSERSFVDLDPIFNVNLDEDYDFRASGITRSVEQNAMSIGLDLQASLKMFNIENKIRSYLQYHYCITTHAISLGIHKEVFYKGDTILLITRSYPLHKIPYKNINRYNLISNTLFCDNYFNLHDCEVLKT